MKYEHICQWAAQTPWAILPSKLAVILDFLAFARAGGILTPEEIEARVGPRRAVGQSDSGSVAVLPLYGVIAQRAGMIGESSGGTSIEQFTKAFRAAIADPNVAAIVLDVDSPGGSVPGVDELSSEIYRARGGKPIIAVANSLAASAAYWIASAADEIVVSPSAEVGSIGVFAAHQDLSKSYDAQGVKTSLISAGKYKVEGNPYEPLTADARAAMQERVDDYYGMFTRAVARNRGTSVDQVRNGYGEGRVVGARQAVQLGMANRVGTLDSVIGRLAGSPQRAAQQAYASGNGLLAGPIEPLKSPSIASKDEPWDAGAVLKALPDDQRQWLKVFAWYDDSADDPDDDGLPDAKAAWKLPHAKADGTLVPRGLYAAAQRIEGADIPDGDKAAVRKHLQFHYDELGEEAPWEGPEPDEKNGSADVDFRKRRLRLLSV